MEPQFDTIQLIIGGAKEQHIHPDVPLAKNQSETDYNKTTIRPNAPRYSQGCIPPPSSWEQEEGAKPTKLIVSNTTDIPIYNYINKC